MNNFFNAINDNIIIYNGELLPENIRYTVTKSVINLFANCKTICDQIIYRNHNCIWFVLSKNISEYYVIMALKNVFAKATNKDILKQALINTPSILQNTVIPVHQCSFNYIFDIGTFLVNTPDTLHDTFDLLS